MNTLETLIKNLQCHVQNHIGKNTKMKVMVCDNNDVNIRHSFNLNGGVSTYNDTITLFANINQQDIIDQRQSEIIRLL